MRGLAPAERAALIDAASPSSGPLDAVVATADEAAVFERLEGLARVRTVYLEDDGWQWSEWCATDLGLLALRVCPQDAP